MMKLVDRSDFERLLINYAAAEGEVKAIETQFNAAKSKRHDALHAVLDWVTAYGKEYFNQGAAAAANVPVGTTGPGPVPQDVQ